MLLADGVTDATLLLAVVTLFVAWATWRLGSRASEETRAGWRPVILVRARTDEMNVKLRLAVGRLEVDLENTGRGPALDVFSEGLLGLESESVRVSALAPAERWTCRFSVSPGQDARAFRVTYSDISGGAFSTTVVVSLRGQGDIELVSQMVEAHPSLDVPWMRLMPRGRVRRWAFRKFAAHRGYRLPTGDSMAAERGRR